MSVARRSAQPRGLARRHERTIEIVRARLKIRLQNHATAAGAQTDGRCKRTEPSPAAESAGRARQSTLNSARRSFSCARNKLILPSPLARYYIVAVAFFKAMD